MSFIIPVRGYEPQWGKDCFIAPNATMIGEVIMGDFCSVWFNVVLRGDVNFIRIGNKVNIQDGVIIHGSYEKCGTTIEDNVSVGHGAILHGCRIKENVLIGMGAIVMDNAIVNSNTIIAAGSLVLQNTVVDSNSIYAGTPAKKIKNLSPEVFKNEIERIANNYLLYASWFKK